MAFAVIIYFSKRSRQFTFPVMDVLIRRFLAVDNTAYEYMEVVNNMLTARNLLIKTSITGNVNCLDRFEKYIMTAKAKEIEVLNKVVERL